MFAWNNDPADQIKNLFKNNSTKLALIAAGVATIGCAYFLGKSQGDEGIDVFLISSDEFGVIKEQLISAAK